MLYRSIFFLALVFTIYYLTTLPQESLFTDTDDIKTNAYVLRVVDGDTILASYDLNEEKVRIIGINTPETVDPRSSVECFGKEASEKASEVLSGRQIVLENYLETDQYGRVLAYVEVEGKDFGAEMISQGYAYSYKTYPHERMILYNQLEEKAQADKVGLWADGVCE